MTPAELAHLAALRKTQSSFEQKPQYLYLPMPDYSDRLNNEADSPEQHNAWKNGDWSDDDEATLSTVKLGEDDLEDTLPGVGSMTLGLDLGEDADTDTLPGIGGQEEAFLLLPEMRVLPDNGTIVCGKKCDKGSECLKLKGHCSREGCDTQHGCIFYPEGGE